MKLLKEWIQQTPYSFAVVLLFVVFVSCYAPFESAYIHDDQLPLWTLFKVLNVLIAIPALITTCRRTPNDTAIGLFFFACCLQPFTSGLYRPLYETAYFQGALACAFIPARNKILYPLIFFCGAIAMCSLEYFRNLFGLQVDPMSGTDLKTTILLFFIIAVIIHYMIARFRDERSLQTLRLSLLGQHSIQLAHDLKGLLSGPLLQVTALHDRTDEMSHTEMKKVISFVKEDLVNASLVLSQMSEMSQTDESLTDLDLEKSIHSMLVLFQRRFANAKVTVAANGSIKTYPRRFQFILFNALLNCAEQMSRSEALSNLEVRITRTPQGLTIEDNAGGMSDEIMRVLKSGGIASSKSGSGGLGFQIIHAEARALKLGVNFENHQTLGAPGFKLELIGF